MYFLKRTVFVALLCLLPFGGICAAEEDLQFVDSNGVTGYYVDANSLSYPADQLIDARIAVIKANTNRIFFYAVQFNLEKRTYTIYASEVQSYDKRQVLEATVDTQPERPYSYDSPMHAITEYINKELRK